MSATDSPAEERHLLSAADEHLEAAADALKPLLRHPPVYLTGEEAQQIGHDAITELAKTRNRLRFAAAVVATLREDLAMWRRMVPAAEQMADPEHYKRVYADHPGQPCPVDGCRLTSQEHHRLAFGLLSELRELRKEAGR